MLAFWNCTQFIRTEIENKQLFFQKTHQSHNSRHHKKFFSNTTRNLLPHPLQATLLYTHGVSHKNITTSISHQNALQTTHIHTTHQEHQCTNHTSYTETTVSKAKFHAAAKCRSLPRSVCNIFHKRGTKQSQSHFVNVTCHQTTASTLQKNEPTETSRRKHIPAKNTWSKRLVFVVEVVRANKKAQ